MTKIITLKNRISDLETLWSTKFCNQKCTLELECGAAGVFSLYWDSSKGFALTFKIQESPFKEIIIIKDEIFDSTYLSEKLMRKFAEGLIKMEEMLSTEVPDSVIEVLDKLIKNN